MAEVGLVLTAKSTPLAFVLVGHEIFSNNEQFINYHTLVRNSADA